MARRVAAPETTAAARAARTVPPSLDTDCAEASPARLWRLSHAQYDNTVAALLGTAKRSAATFEPEGSGTGFTNGSDVAFVSPLLAEQYMETAEALAAEAVEDLDSLLPCGTGDAEDRECVSDFIEKFGGEAFRRPLDAEQRELYLELYDGSPNADGVEAVIAAMLSRRIFFIALSWAAKASGATASVRTPSNSRRRCHICSGTDRRMRRCWQPPKEAPSMGPRASRRSFRA
jgi:hypothetical protein